MKKTQEQLDIIEAAKTLDKMKINAYAGAAKTSTLAMVAEEIQERSLLLVFNKSAQIDAMSRFPDHVEVRTTHSIAYQAIGRSYQAKLTRPKGGYVNVAGTGSEIAKFFGVKPLKGKTKTITAPYIGLLAKDCVGCFESSSSEKIGTEHLKGMAEAVRRYEVKLKDLQKKVLDLSKRLWQERIDVCSDVLCTHDTYMKLYQLSKPKLDYRVIYLDEAQDTSDCVLDIFKNQEGNAKLIMVGDSRQQIYCQPEGTQVKVVKDKIVTDTPIEDLNVGDCVLSYDMEKQHLHRWGKPIVKYGHRIYDGEMITVESEGVTTKYTADHEVVLRIGHYNNGKYAHYLMRKGGKFRTGITPWQAQREGVFGVANRGSSEGADSAWLLGVYSSREEASIQEALFSYKYKVPDSCFCEKRSPWGKKFWDIFEHDQDLLALMWTDTGLCESDPIWCPKNGSLTFRGAFVTSARNIVEGMLVCHLGTVQKGHGKIPLSNWKPISSVKKEQVVGVKVYSMEVERDHTYVGDGILTHNCWRGAVNAMKKLNWPVKNLTTTFRFGQDISDLAGKILGGDTHIKSMEGLSSNIGDNVVDTSKPYTVLYRTNACLVMDAVRLLSKGGSVNLEVDVADFLRKLESSLALYEGKLNKVKHEELLSFDDWKDLTDEAEFNGELKRIQSIVEDGKVQWVISSLNKQSNIVNPSVVYTTAHKSKGREWDQIILGDDYPSCFLKGEWVGLEETEQNLLYVACTRAKKALNTNKTVDEIVYYGEAKGSISNDNNNI